MTYKWEIIMSLIQQIQLVGYSIAYCIFFISLKKIFKVIALIVWCIIEDSK